MINIDELKKILGDKISKEELNAIQEAVNNRIGLFKMKEKLGFDRCDYDYTRYRIEKDFYMSNQIHQGTFDFNGYTFDNFGIDRKPKNAFWTSTLNAENLTEWHEFLMNETQVRDLKSPNYKMKIKENAKIYEVYKREDEVKLYEKYGMYMLCLDFDKFAEDYDAIHYGMGYITSSLEQSIFYGWDVESTVWFRNVFEPVYEEVQLSINFDEVTDYEQEQREMREFLNK